MVDSLDWRTEETAKNTGHVKNCWKFLRPPEPAKQMELKSLINQKNAGESDD